MPTLQKSRCRHGRILVPALLLALFRTPALGDPGAPLYTFTTLAGRASIGCDDGSGTAARFNSPQGVAVDRAGNVYVADTANHTIRRVTPTGIVTTIAGRAGQPGSSDGLGRRCAF